MSPGSSLPLPAMAAAGGGISPWQRAEAEERRHTAENLQAEQALQIAGVWRPGTTTAALAKAAAPSTAPHP